MRVHHSHSLKLAFFAGLAVASAAAPRPAAADNEPVIVVPGRPGVPVMINGVDVSGAVIEGEWGLNRPGVVTPTVIMPYWPPNYFGTAAPYFPRTGHRPPYGRLEVVPPHRRPSIARPYFREWHSESDPSPATSPGAFSPPPVIVTPPPTHSRFAPRPRHRAPPHTP